MKRTLLFIPFLMLSFTLAFGQFSIQKVLVEEFTGTWCGYCADGSIQMTRTLNRTARAIGVGVHTGDSMAIPVGRELADFYRPAFPQALINRPGAPISRGAWSNAAATEATSSSSVEVSFDSLGWDATTRQMTAKVKYRFTGLENGDLRINLLIVEDSVSGLGHGYDQINYDNGTPGHPYQGAGDPIVGFTHRHVLRDALGGAWGIPNVIPSSVGFGDEGSFTFSYFVDAAYDMAQVSVVAMVTRHDSSMDISLRPVLNAEGVHFLDNLTPLSNTAIDDPAFGTEVKVYPNPTSDRVMFTFDLQHTGMLTAEVYDIMGKKVADVANGSLNAGLHSLYWDTRDAQGASVANGMYLFKISSENESLTRRVMVRR